MIQAPQISCRAKEARVRSSSSTMARRRSRPASPARTSTATQGASVCPDCHGTWHQTWRLTKLRNSSCKGSSPTTWRGSRGRSGRSSRTSLARRAISQASLTARRSTVSVPNSLLRTAFHQLTPARPYSIYLGLSHGLGDRETNLGPRLFAAGSACATRLVVCAVNRTGRPQLILAVSPGRAREDFALPDRSIQ